MAATTASPEKHELRYFAAPGQLPVLYANLREAYAADDAPWIVGLSGGRDGVAVLQAVWYALAELPADRRVKPVYVLATDTGVLVPVLAERINAYVEAINRLAREHTMPFTAAVVPRLPAESFWVQLIGRGRPIPTHQSRWCTEAIKQTPTTRAIMGRVAEHGEAVLLVSSREDEFTTQAQVWSLMTRHGERFARHTALPHVRLYAPIADWSSADAWAYLLQVPSPWGIANRDLVALYRSVQGECPMVVDRQTLSCGYAGLYACMPCTVVEDNRSLEALVDEGYDWLEVMVELRDRLRAEPSDAREVIEVKPPKAATLQQTLLPMLETRLGDYTMAYCQVLLRDVVQAEARLREAGAPEPYSTLVSPAELAEIKRLWTERWQDHAPSVQRTMQQALA